jgi:hypothetical protein
MIPVNHRLYLEYLTHQPTNLLIPLPNQSILRCIYALTYYFTVQCNLREDDRRYILGLELFNHTLVLFVSGGRLT